MPTDIFSICTFYVAVLLTTPSSFLKSADIRDSRNLLMKVPIFSMEIRIFEALNHSSINLERLKKRTRPWLPSSQVRSYTLVI